MRLLSVAVWVLTSVVPFALRAQSVGRADPGGVMDFRADLVAFGPAFVSPGEDGLVALSFDERVPIAGFHPRDPRATREVFRPDDVIEWVNGVERALASAPNEQSAVSSTHAISLGRGHSVRIIAEVTTFAGDRRVRFAVNRCGIAEPPVSVRLDTVMANLAAFRRAATEARTLTLQTVTPNIFWFEHAVGCPAIPLLQNRPPAWPATVTTLLPHQELVQFVINIDGRVEPTSVRFFPKSDERFTKAIREVLPSWGFFPATRMGQPVRQLAHVNVGFVPPLAIDARGRSCSNGAFNLLEPPPINPPRCEGLFTTRFQSGVVSVIPRGDGTVRLANAPEDDGRYLITEPVHHFAVIPATALRQFVDSASRILVMRDTSTIRPPSREGTRPSPKLGTASNPGFAMSMLWNGTVTAAIACRGYRARQGPMLRIDSASFQRFRETVDSALQRVPWQRQWSQRGESPFVEHELTCSVERNSTEHAWLRPQATRQVSREVVMRFVVSPTGGVERGSIEFMPGQDSLTERLVAENLMTWSFTPPLVGSTPVRAQVHGRYILRPADSDAVNLLAVSPRGRTAAESLPPTVFSRPRTPLPAPDRRETWALPGERQAVLNEIRKRTGIALLTWGATRAQFLNGLKLGDRLMVTVWLHDLIGREEHAYMVVDSIVDQKIYGVLATPMLRLLDWQPGDRISTTVPNFADWTIVRADGSVEGNVVARYIDDYVRFRRRR